MLTGVPSNLLIQFKDDNIDQTPQLATTLEAASITNSTSNSSKSQVAVRTLPGDHVRPLRQAFGDLPPELAQVANQAVSQGSFFLQGLSNMATQAGFKEVHHPPHCFGQQAWQHMHHLGCVALYSSKGPENTHTMWLLTPLLHVSIAWVAFAVPWDHVVSNKVFIAKGGHFALNAAVHGVCWP